MAEISKPGKCTKSISMLSWGYNEEGLIEDFLRRAAQLLSDACDDYELIFVNDGSKDATGAIADRMARENPRIKVIHHPRNLNVGLAARTAVAAATKDILFWQTVDWSYDLSNLSTFLALMDHYDVVQGIRPVPIRPLAYVPVVRSVYRIRTRSDNFSKAVISLSNYYILRILFGVPFQDFQNVTFYPRRLAQSLPLTGVSSFVNPEMLIRSYAAGANFLEVPIGFIKRTAGEAKGTKWRTVLRSVIDIFRNWTGWGLRLRLEGRLKPGPGRIQRVSVPFELNGEVLQLCLPLFKDYQVK